MNYWLTTHWPPREDTIDKFADTGAWVRDGKDTVLNEMRAGDMLFIYESKSGKTNVEKTADGKEKKVPRIRGKEGIIALATITTQAIDIGRSGYEFYADGSEAWWRYKANAQVINSEGFIGRRMLANILGYSEQYAFRGFGDQNSGVKRLSKDEFEKIHSAFLSSEAKIETVLDHKWRFGGDGGGEGPLHKSLKEFIAARPEEALNELGLRTIKVEFEFPTGDRVDILLEDRDGRLVTVEVEIDCDDEEVVGPLQCMKYRALMAYLSERRVAEVRTMLVARSVVSSLQKRCKEYQIEVIEISTWPGGPTS